MSFILDIKSRFGNYLESMRWVVFLFLGGALNTMAILTVANYLKTINVVSTSTNPEAQFQIVITVIQFILLPIFLFFIPIMLSIIFTKLGADKILVPSMFIQIISLGWFLFYLPTTGLDSDKLIMYGQMMVYYTFFGGIAQDQLSFKLVGIPARREDLEKFSLKVYAEREKIVRLLLSERYKNNIRLSEKIEKHNDNLILRSVKRGKMRITIELQESLDDESIIVNVVMFQKGYYYLKSSEELKGFAETYQNNIESILRSQKPEIKFKTNPIEFTESLEFLVLREFEGVLSQLEITWRGWFKTIMFIASLIAVGVFYFFFKDGTNALITLVLICLYLAFELPHKLLKKRNE
ncbi:Hypothetical protein Nlim_1887 [Candidatus Nitrosarchaeum limnium SFB1]|jgi:hypothetical protein|uniref:Uncharacterized protein n=1 Tax=Candidatus Nitrosarchaeum limnium SFB1 TaxID=886738 RepID=F3KNA6_9ARCH|nr:Hypothetical protein Nlim_1887 [Candidatus Nitrosarchaeum limnium SFB1]